MSQDKPGTVREIDGHKYTVFMLDPDTAIDVASDLERWLLPAVGELAGLATDDKDGLVQQAVGNAIGKFVAGADKAVIKRLVRTMMRVTTCDGVGRLSEGDAWVAHFHGRFWPMMKVTAFAIEVNFFDFFGGLGGIRTWVTAQLADLRTGASASPPASAGGSTAS